MKRYFSIDAWAALILMFVGIATMSGWLIRNAVVVQLQGEFVGMVFSTAACFTLVAVALLLRVCGVREAERKQAAIGWTLIGVAAAVAVQYAAGIELPLNLPSLHSWLYDGNPVPGRMALTAAFGFMLAGGILVLMHRVRSKASGRAILGATFIMLLLGFIGLAGYLLRLDMLYSWIPARRIAIQSAVCMIVAGVGLWGQWRKDEWYRSQRYFRDDEKTGYVAATILTVIALTAGIVGFSVQQATMGKALTGSLQARLKSHSTLFRAVVREAMADAENVASRPHILQFTRLLSGNPGDAEAARQLHALGKSLVASAYTGIAVYDANNRELLRLGHFAQKPQIQADLGGQEPASLLWKDGVVFRARLALRDGGVIGYIEVEQALPLITELLAGSDGLGKTGELGICIRQADSLACFPQYRNPKPHYPSRVSASGSLTPMAHATDGRSGIFTGRDYREHSVLAAYGPLADTGIGIVVKQDTEELYKPIRQQLNWYLPMLLLLVSGGALLLRSQVKPLVSKLLQSQHEANARELHIRSIVDNIAEGIITLNERGVIESFNRGASRIFGYTVDEIIGTHITALMPPEMRALHESGMQRYLHSNEARFVGMGNRELPALHKDGSVFPLELSITELRMDHHRLFIGIVRDISERKKAAEQVQHMAHFDILTDLPNRALLHDRLKQALANARRNENRLALMFIDLDKFKPVNDNFGHDVGDLLLKEVAGRLRDSLRESDTVARVGGDEFIVLLPEIDAGQYAVLVADKILATLSAPFCIAGHVIVISASIGIAVYPEDGTGEEALMKGADSAMYHAKQSRAAITSFGQMRQDARSSALSE